ncbi:MAG: ABC-F family ATP-binding cassette domain-containing protein [Clostridia bacterium]
MIQLRVRNVAKYFDGIPVFSGVSFDVAQGDRLGIVGPNGAGKSTLLRLMAGRMIPDEGTVVTVGDRVSRAMMTQEADFDPEATVLSTVMEAFEDLRRLEDRLRELETAISECNDDLRRRHLLERYGRLMTSFEDAGGYGIEARAREILGGLGFTEDMLDRRVGTFSGGEGVRLALARALLREPSILLLDEPTNHLDLASNEWLEEFLRGYPGTLVVVSHDRYFLDRVATSILEILGGGVEVYRGNYSAYVKEREVRRERQMAKYRRQEEEIERLRDFVRRYGAGQRAREAKDREKKIERMERVEPPPELPGGINLTLRAPRSGREVLRARGLHIRRGAEVLVEDLDLDLYRQQKIALLGPNGAGKTTLLRALVGETPPEGGQIRYGVGVTTAYFPQDLAFSDESVSVVDEIRRSFRGMPISEVRSHLAKFGFTGDDVFDPLYTLSGGERTRLHLARIELAEATLLVLDEPTNHLDLAAREGLEEALAEFDGTAIFVTHDRYFVDRVATDLWVLRDARLEAYSGGYTEYRRRMAAWDRARSQAESADPRRDDTRESPRRAGTGKERTPAPKDEDLDRLEEEIERLEKEREELASVLGEPGSYHGGKGGEEVQRYHQIEKRLAGLYARWEEVGRILEERDEL